MSYQKEANRSIVYLLPPSVDEWIGPNDPVRFLAMFVESLDLETLGFKMSEEGAPGAPSYGVKMLLSVWLYGYMEKVTSSRGLERACRRDMGLIWLTGQHYPDHNTLWRFWHRYRSVISEVFRQTVLTADRMELIGTVVQAVDGTKIQSRCSAQGRWRAKSLLQKLDKINESIAEAEKLINDQSNGETAAEVLPEELSSAKELRTALESALEEMKQEKTKDLHPDEPEARLMRTGGNGRMCYNAQAMVDQQNQMITATGLNNQANDMHWLVPMLEESNSNLPHRSPLTLADAGYDTITQIHQAENLGFDFLINEKRAKRMRENKFHTTHFTYLKESHQLICPHTQHALKYSYFRHEKRGIPNVSVFRCYKHDCHLRDQCCPTAPKQVNVSAHQQSLFRQQKRRQTTSAKFLLACRKAIVEPVFGRIKQQMNFRRFTFKGQNEARAQWNMICAAYNLKRMARKWASSKT